ncbi:hypothetical protein Aperf_G00000009409 [Anoplocephala perfoliata]
MNQRVLFYPSFCVRFDFPRSLSLGNAFFTRLRGFRGRTAFHDKTLHQYIKKIPDPRSRSPLSRSPAPVVNGSRTFKQIFFRCGLFTFVSVNTIFAGTMIWNYENWKSNISRYRKSSFRDMFTSIVGRPPRSSDIFWAIALANFVVYVLNNTRRFGPTFLCYFANSPFGPWPAISMVLSIFSHHMFTHMFLNMYVLHNFTQPLIRVLGMEQFFAVFLGGGIFASFLSSLSKSARGSRIPSIGASGAVCAVLGTFCMLEPQARLCVPIVCDIIPHSFSAGSACLAITAFEAFGTILLSGRSPIDHAAHLGGLVFGMYYGTEGKNLALRYREVVVTAWRNFKGEAR